MYGLPQSKIKQFFNVFRSLMLNGVYNFIFNKTTILTINLIYSAFKFDIKQATGVQHRIHLFKRYSKRQTKPTQMSTHITC